MMKNITIVLLNLMLICPLFCRGATIVQVNSAEKLEKYLKKGCNSSDIIIQLDSDIDLIGDWTPIGDAKKPFIGHLDGGGHIIRGLEIGRNSSVATGLFGVLQGTVENLTIKDACLRVTNCDSVGIIAGAVYKSGEIKNCRIENSVIEAKDFVGSVAGICYGYDCCSDCHVEDVQINANRSVGGICGYSSHVVSCSFDGEIFATENVGGIIGKGSASYCYANVNLIGYENVGGIVGVGEASNCYTTGLIHSDYYGGGIIGYGYEEGTDYGKAICCYANCDIISGNNYIGGIVGEKASNLRNCAAINKELYAKYSYPERVGAPNKSIKYNIYKNYVWDKTKIYWGRSLRESFWDKKEEVAEIDIDSLKTMKTYQEMMLGWDLYEKWKIQEGGSFPYLCFQSPPVIFNQDIKSGDCHLSGKVFEDGIVTVKIGKRHYSTETFDKTWSIDIEEVRGGEMVRIFATSPDKIHSYAVTKRVKYNGSGTKENPYQVTTPEGLKGMIYPGYYKLMNNIDLTEYIERENPYFGWIPVLTDRINEFDGNGFVISGLWFNLCGKTRSGLFSLIFEDCTVKNLTVEINDKGIQGRSHIGGIVGTNFGMISGCEVMGGDIGFYKVMFDIESGAGAVAGLSYGSITDCLSRNNIFVGGQDMTFYNYSDCYIGGIAGRNDGEINRCIVYGSRDKSSYVRGTSGCIAGGDLKESEYCDACFDLNNPYNLRGFYRDCDYTDYPDGFDDNSPRINLFDVTEKDAKSKSFYSNKGFEFDSLWGIDDGYTYPYFKRNKVMITSIEISDNEITGIPGQYIQLTANVLPLTATNTQIKWESDNKDIASVSNEGEVEIHNYGKCVISAKTVDGSGLIATCAVNVYSGIEEIIAESNKKWSLYNLQGILVKSELSQDDIRHISPGIYILHSGNKVVKIKI